MTACGSAESDDHRWTPWRRISQQQQQQQQQQQRRSGIADVFPGDDPIAPEWQRICLTCGAVRYAYGFLVDF